LDLKILHIETATSVCSICLSINGKLISIREENIEKIHASAITIFIDEVTKESDIEFSELNAIAVSKGPGSYTGLRIGVSTAKGLCFALNKPLIGISTLQAMAIGFSKNFSLSKGDIFICPLLDARRMEVYSAFYNHEGNIIRDIKADIIDENSYHEYLQKQKVYFIGNGVAKCKSLLSKYKNAFFDENFLPSSQYMISLAEKAYAENQFKDVAYFEPYYLKDFVTTSPQKEKHNS
jgi:tRNA threonylcarbamoyladenosine biosynthesis protein TsaB